MQLIRNNWPSTPASNGVKFVAQFLREMLRPDAFESFRVHSLDTIARLDEGIKLIQDVNAQGLNILVLEPVLQELSWSLKRDVIASDVAAELVAEFEQIIRPGAKRDVAKLSIAMGYLRKVIAPEYKQKLEQKILDTYLDTRHRADLRIITSSYCTYLINRGYAKRHVAELVESMFFTDDVKRTGAESLKRLFAQLADEDERYKVHTVLSPEFGRYLSKFPGTVLIEPRNLTGDAAVEIRDKFQFEETDLIYISSVSARDPYSAAAQVEDFLASVRAMTYLARAGIRFRWTRAKYVMLHNGRSGKSVDIDSLQLQKPAFPTGRRIKNLQQLSNQVLKSFDETSTERLTSSLGTSALARSARSPENQVISLWSAFEVLLSNPKDGPRITHYLDLIVPCVCFKYARRYIVAIYDDLLVHYRRRMKVIMGRLPNSLGIDDYTRFTHLVFDKAHERHLASLFDVLSDNPAAMHRIWKLHKDFGSPKQLNRSLDAHQDRVGWQLHRIYRVRNQVVHAGQRPPYIKSLTLNTFEYYRTTVVTVLGVAQKEDDRSNIDNIIGQISIDYNIYKKYVAAYKGDVFRSEDFARVFK